MIVLMLLLAADLPLETRYDLTCAESAVSVLGWMGDKQDEAHSRVYEVASFYLGSLSGRDENTDWMGVIRADMAASKRPETFYDQAIGDCTSRMVQKMRISP